MKKASHNKPVKETRTTYHVPRHESKPAVTIPVSVRDAAQQLAQQLNISLSELYTTALQAYIAEHQGAATLTRRQPGSAKGLIVMADDFDAPLADFAEYQP
jgi:hypothetical protein